MISNLRVEVSMKLMGTLARSAQVARQLGRDVFFSSEAGDFSAVTVRERPSFAAESAFSFPGMPT